MANKPFKKLRFSLTGDTYSPVDEQARQNIGDLSQLDTTHKDNLVEAINEAAQSGGGGSGVPSGGSKGQVLTKRSSVEGDAGWEYPPVMYATGNDPSNLSVSWNENYSVMDFFMRQSLVQAEYEGSYIVHLKLIKAYITAVPPDFTSVYHFFFGAVTEIVNGTAAFGTLEVVCDSPSAHSGVGVYSEVSVGVSDEAVQDAVDEYLTEHPAMTGMFTNAAKSALIELLKKVAYVDGNGQQYLDELITNLAATVTSIDAVFTQGSAVIYDTDSLETLERYLVVTASYSDGTSAVVSGYELSGALAVGTSTITASYGGQSDSFTVTVTERINFTPQNIAIISGGSAYVSGSSFGYNGTSTARGCMDPMVTVIPFKENDTYKISLNGLVSVGYSALIINLGVDANTINWDVVEGTSKTFITSAEIATVSGVITHTAWDSADAEFTWPFNDNEHILVLTFRNSSNTTFTSTNKADVLSHLSIMKVTT